MSLTGRFTPNKQASFLTYWSWCLGTQIVLIVLRLGRYLSLRFLLPSHGGELNFICGAHIK